MEFLNGWVGVKALTLVGIIMGTEAKTVMYEALGFSLGAVHQVGDRQFIITYLWPLGRQIGQDHRASK
jgi:hypothetical protein